MRASSARVASNATFIGALLSLVLGGCSVRLISEYDEIVDRSAGALQRQMDAHLTNIETADSAGRAYGASAQFYADYAVELRSLTLRAETYPKNDLTVRELKNVERMLKELHDLHRGQGTLSAGAAAPLRDQFNIAWKAIITLENAKRR